MKKKLVNLFMLFLLTIYFVFSSGIIVSFHYCCKSHCCIESTTTSCCKDNDCDDKTHDADFACDVSTITCQQHCSDTQFYLKIVDNYDTNEKLSLVHQTSFIREIYVKHPNNNELPSCCGAALKRNDLLLSHPVIQGDSFLKFSQQFIDYA